MNSIFDRMRGVGGRNFAWMSAGNILFAAAQAGFLSLIAQFGGARAVGEFALAMSVVTPVFQLTRLRLRDIVATDMAHEHRVSEYLRLAALSALAGLVIAVMAGLILEMSGTVMSVIVLMSIARGSEGLSHISYGFQQRNDAMGPVGRSLILRGIGSMALLSIGYARFGSVSYGTAGILAGHLAVLAIYDLPRVRRESTMAAPTGRFGSVETRRLALAALPLGAFSFLVALGNNLPRLIIDAVDGLQAVGIFSTFAFIVVGISTVTRALGQTASPRLAHAIANSAVSDLVRHLRSLALMSSIVGVSGVLAAMIGGEWFLELFFGHEFAAHTGDFVLMLFAGWAQFVVSPWAIALIAARRYRWLLAIQALTVVSIGTVALWLIPEHGIRGAVGSLLAGGMVRLGATVIALRKLTRELSINSSGRIYDVGPQRPSQL